MIDFQTIAAIIFLIALTIFVFLMRKDMETKQIAPYFLYFSMYKTTWGLKLMDFFAKKHKRFIIYLGYLGILVGFAGMILISYGLINNIYVLFTKPEATPGVGLVLPFKAKGVFFVPFFYWIISIFVIAVVHEFAHGLIARANNLKVKSSGFAFLGSSFRGIGAVMVVLFLYNKMKSDGYIFGNSFNFFDYSSPYFWLMLGIVLLLISFFKNFIAPVIPAAFVEPDEKELKKRPHKEQLSVFAAGPFSNIAFAFLFIGIASLVIAPIATAVIEANGVKVVDYVKGQQKFPAENARIKIGEIIQKADNMPTPYVNNLSAILKNKKPDYVVAIQTDKAVYNIKLAKNPENQSLGYIGAYLEQDTKIKDNVKAAYGEFLPNALLWVYGLFVILFVLNFGIGLFNLVPLGPLDGGRMFHLVLQKFFDKEKANKVWFYVGMFFLVIVFINIAAGFGLFKFLF